MLNNKKKIKKVFVIILIAIISGIIFFYQTKKVGFHEDEVYSIVSSVNSNNGLMSSYNQFSKPEWKTKEYVKDYATLNNYHCLHLKSIFNNQKEDNHPPFFYILVYFSSIFFSGTFSKYIVFIVNFVTFILSCFLLKNILDILNKENLTIATLIFYGLSMGTISMVIYQRMYMLLTFFILLYFYFSINIYKNDFNLTKKMNILLGITTVLGFLTQYFFAIYAFFILILMIIQMIKSKKYKNIIRYVGFHILYAITGILLFTPCINHLLFTDRGISNLNNSNYFIHLYNYIMHLAYAFTINDKPLLIFFVLALFLLCTIHLFRKHKEKFVVLLTIVPSVIYFLLVSKLTSFQELRYIFTIIPFITLMLFFILDDLLHIKYKNIIIVVIAIILSLNGIIFSKPKFLFEEYKECLDIANSNKEKSFVYVYDNFFNHMQSLPEMMIYKKTLIVNTTNDELTYVINDNNLNSESSYILCIKTYMNNNFILDQIKNNTDFKNIIKLYEGGCSSEVISNNLYLVSKYKN